VQIIKYFFKEYSGKYKKICLKYKFSRKKIFQVNDTLEIFRVLLNKKPDVNKMNKYDNNTALHLGKEKNLYYIIIKRLSVLSFNESVYTRRSC
jgi:hypothetical protein